MEQENKIIQKQKKQNRWGKVMQALCCMVIFCTTYMLILPAITMTAPDTVLACQVDIHDHDESCYNEDGELACGYADFVVHEHDENCYDADGNLVCELEEIQAHVHDESCGVWTEEVTAPEEQPTEEVPEEGVKTPEENANATEPTGSESTEESTDGMTEGSTETSTEESGGDSTESAGNETAGNDQGESADGTVNTPGVTVDAPDVSAEASFDAGETSYEMSSYGAYDVGMAGNFAYGIGPCGFAELHEHNEDCYDEYGNLVCGKIEVREHVHDETCVKSHGMKKVMLLAENSGEPIDVTSFVVPQNDDGKKTQLCYKESTDAEWTPVAEDAPIPGDATLRLDIVYEDVPVAELVAACGQLCYDVPGFMRNPTVQGNITSGQTEVGHIAVQDGKAVITFYEAFLDELKEKNQTVLSGTFYIESALNLSYIQNTTPGELVIGGVTIKLNWDGEIIAKYGTADIEKSVGTFSVVDGHPYLTYTLNVTAGADGCLDVKVVDKYSDSSKPGQNVEEYVGVTGTAQNITDVSDVTETGAPDGKGGSVYLGTVTTGEDDNTTEIAPAGDATQKPGIMIWEIGNMAPGENRTLTYKVKLTDNYIGVQSKGALINVADVYSGSYPKDSDKSTFTPKAGMNLKKSSADPVKNEDGTYTIHYTVTVTANKDNTYTLDNIKIDDRLNHSAYKTDDKYLKTLSYDTTSFELHNGGNASAPVMATPQNPHDGQSNPQMNADEKGFVYYVGDMAPGEQRTLTYNVTVSPEFLAIAGNGTGTVKNRALVYLDDTRSDTQSNHIQAYNCNRDMTQKHWARKLAGDKIESTENVPMHSADGVYDGTGSSISPAANPGSFTVLAESYRYNVIVNETGDWDVSSASMADTLGGTHMEFVGYVRVDAYNIAADDQLSATTSDKDALAYMNSHTPAETVWVKVDNATSFNFSPNDIGLGDGNYAIMMTYYAQPVNMDGVTQVIVANEFNLSGEIGVGNYKYTLTGITVAANVTISGSDSFSASKQAWYYNRNEGGNYNNGALYWAIKLDGTTIPAGTELKDTTISASGDRKKNTLYEDSVVGVLKGSGDISAYADYSAAATDMQQIEILKYTVKRKNDRELYLTFNEAVKLVPGESLYVIVRTKPDSIPVGNRDVYNYQNELQHRFGSTDAWISDNTAEKWLYGSENILKELNYAFTWNGTKQEIIKSGKNGQVIQAAYQNSPGTYVAWNIKVNYMGNLAGTYTITDHIPDGMELVYARIKWLGSGYSDRTNTSHQYVPQKTNLGSEWTEHTITADTDKCGTRTTYYYTKGQDVCWDVADLIAGNERDNYSIDCQVLCRVTDPNVLLGGNERTFNNTVTLTTQDGQDIGNANDSVTLKKQTLAKKGNYDPNVNGGRYPFELTLNAIGEDLIPDTDKITVVDTMSETLKLDVSSIVVKNTKTSALLSSDQYNVAVEGQTVKITVPDNLPLTITYEALVQAAPGQAVDIKNDAHWEGYTAGTSSIVEVKGLSYAAGGTVTTSDTLYLTIQKLDQSDVNTHLQGAAFSITEVELVNGAFVETDGGQSWTGITGSDGTLTAGRESDKLMKWNTAYQVVETAAPEGYILNDTPHYFAVAKAEGVEYPEEQLAAYRAAGATIYYHGAEYTYPAYNKKITYSATVNKSFTDASNQSLTKVDGSYKFGIYEMTGDVEATEATEIQTLTISGESTDTTVTFYNLDKTKTYCIYELDDNGSKIANGTTALINDKLFEVSYDNGNSVTFSEETTNVTVGITNSVHYVGLPETGGMGTTGIYALGALLMAISAAALVLRNRRSC